MGRVARAAKGSVKLVPKVIRSSSVNSCRLNPGSVTPGMNAYVTRVSYQGATSKKGARTGLLSKKPRLGAG